MSEFGGKILIVDDIADNLRLLAHMLKENGYTPYPANSGAMALRFLQSTLPDAILLDAMMPDMDGYEVCRRLNEDPLTCDIPVIFVSAADHVFDKVKAFTAGAVDYVVKPFQQEEVIARLRTHLALRDLQKRLEQRVEERTAALSAINLQLTEEIVERQRAEEALLTTQQDYKSLVDSINGIIWELDIATFRFRYVSQQAETLLGYPRAEWLGPSDVWISRLHPDDRDAVVECFQANDEPNRDIEYRMIAANGQTVWLHNILKVISDNDVPVTLRGVMVDVTQKKTWEERLHYMAHYDALTGLPNRTLLRQRVAKAIGGAERVDGKLALLVIDLDYFKNINDSLGHQAGDALLSQAAERVRGLAVDAALVARLGGDEFVLALPSIRENEDAIAVAEKTLAGLSAPYLVNGHELHSTASIGISVYPTDGDDVDTLMRAADTAMYNAKEKGRNTFRFFTPSLKLAVQNRLMLENGLRQALQREEFMLYFQPQVDLRTGKIFAAEALLRWIRPDGQAVSAGEFVTVAEESGLIIPIGEWVLRDACQRLYAWRKSAFPDLRIAVNLSARQFYQPHFQNVVADILEETGVPPEAIELEITESMLMQPGEDNLHTLAELNAMGVHLSIDDFGTGYSSLAYLRKFPVSVLKIDRSFVNCIGRDRNGTEIVNAIIAMAHSLQLQIVAEGVENAEQAAFLKEQGCQAVQGFFYSRPVPPEEFERLLREQDAVRRAGSAPQ
jgi:diguanylate cyclase (GGDEF)-like protein/PAS domain S-box-containing protein